MLGILPGLDVHCGPRVRRRGVPAGYVLMEHTAFGFAARDGRRQLRAPRGSLARRAERS